MTELDLSGEGKASDAEINGAAEDIFDLLRNFDSPKDAASAFILAHIKFMKAAYPPEFTGKAIEAVELESTLVVGILREGWQ